MPGGLFRPWRSDLGTIFSEALPWALQDFPEARRETLAEGAALLIGRTYSSRSLMVQLCEMWNESLQAACLRGVETSLSFRSDAEWARGR